MLETIRQQLTTIEKEQQVRILYACESGSRAWGFASPDSDYDVRFIYSRREEDYLSIRERRDVIELPVNEVLDISGWDIRKALQLFLKSNAPLYEWLQSPIVYMANGGFAEELRVLAPAYFSGRAGCHHYLSMATNPYEHELQGERVRMKKYFYALRPALAALWIVERRSVPPMQFTQLRALVTDPQWHSAVNDLLEQKLAADEKAMIAGIPLLHDWLRETMAYCKQQADAMPATKNDVGALDIIFRKHIGSHDL